MPKLPDTRVGDDSQPSRTTHNENTSKGTIWPMARSLMPDTERLALAIIDGDEEAMAIVESYQLWPSRATRIVTLTRDDGSVLSKEDLQALTCVEIQEAEEVSGLYEIPPKQNAPKIMSSEDHQSETDRSIAQIIREPISETRSQRYYTESELSSLLNKGFAAYRAASNNATLDSLCNVLNIFAVHRCEVSARQRKFRELTTENDLAQAFVVHAIKKSTKSGLIIKKYYSALVNTMFKNFVSSQLKKLNTNLDRYEQYRPDLKDDHGNVIRDSANDGYWHELWLKTNYFSPEMSDAIYRLSEEDQIYALLRMQGMNQKVAAATKAKGKDEGESAVTSRKREGRIRAALQPFMGYGDERGVAQ